MKRSNRFDRGFDAGEMLEARRRSSIPIEISTLTLDKKTRKTFKRKDCM